MSDDLNIYLRLTREFNAGRTRAILAGGQAVVLYRLAIMSKDGDWVLREEEETMEHVLGVLDAHGARYRFGAPLALPWLQAGWSAHFEFPFEGLRVRTDFVTRPPRLEAASLAASWLEHDRHRSAPEEAKLAADQLILTKQTNREKDYAAIGELARLLDDPLAALRYSRSARDLLEIAARHPELLAIARKTRPCLAATGDGREALDAALDAERRGLMRLNEERLARYEEAARAWVSAWPDVQREIESMPLRQAHARVVAAADGHLPVTVP